MIGILSCVTLTGTALRATRLWDKGTNDKVLRKTNVTRAVCTHAAVSRKVPLGSSCRSPDGILLSSMLARRP